MHLPPLRQLQYLVALRDTLHFGRAATQVNVTQSTLSTGIKELENALGVMLVERTNKSVAFTELGGQIADKARYILMQTEDLVDEARSLSNPLSTPVRLGAIPTIAPYVVSHFIKAIRGRFDGIKLYIRENTTANLMNELVGNKLDLVLLALPYEAGQVATRVMYREGMHLAYHRKSQLVSGKKLDFDSLPDESLLLLDDGHCLRDHALAGCRLKNHKKIHTFGANSLEMLLQMVDEDLGVTIVPDMAVDAGVLKGTHIATRRLQMSRYYRDIGFAWRKGASREKLFNELMDLLQVPAPAQSRTATG
ncbi:MAG TPA: hydrogen peroxide-inducible genes activator [Pseudomonadales bacterium]|nr:hydrogen peroxide-inducible genes activator [Pseudomonadales bacterium]